MLYYNTRWVCTSIVPRCLPTAKPAGILMKVESIRMIKTLILVLKSIAVGAASLVPGVSGGTMAIILGIYDELLGAISRYFRNIRENTIFLAAFGIGAALGILLLADLVSRLFEIYQLPMIYVYWMYLGQCTCAV